MRNRQLYKNYWEWVPTPETNVLLFDIETDALLENVTKVHCICAKEWVTKKTYSWRYDQIDEALQVLSQAPLLVAHNGLDFDIRALAKLFPDCTLPRVLDTLLCARLIYPDIKDKDFRRKVFPKNLIGSHSLKAWGYRLGCYKGKYGEVTENAWERWSPEMQSYCEQDVEVLEALYENIMDAKYSPEAIALEHEFATIIQTQEDVGVHFDRDGAIKLYAELSSKRDDIARELQALFPPKVEREEFIPKVNNKTKGYVKGVPFIKEKYIPFNPNSRQHIAERLKELGWEPSEFTETGQPVINDEVLRTVKIEGHEDLCLKLASYFELVKIIGMLSEGLNGWLKLVDDNNRIHGRVNTCGAVTGRCTHNRPNLAQIPARGSYGKLCRQLFDTPAERVLVGCDASGLELRMLSSYMAQYDDGKYIETILEGDIHTENQKAAGLPTRNDAKTFIYALMYGAGDGKLGTITAPDSSASVQEKHGKKLRSKFYKAIPALKLLTEAVQTTAKNRGFLFGVDGRKLMIRSQHSALNTLLQSAGAVLMKLATVILHWELHEQGLMLGRDYWQVLHVHKLHCGR